MKRKVIIEINNEPNKLELEIIPLKEAKQKQKIILTKATNPGCSSICSKIMK